MNILRRGIQTVKDMVFPVFCLGCRREGAWVCDVCFSTIDTTGVLLCPVCHETQPYGMCCPDCQDYSYIDSHVAGVVYEHGTLASNMIEALKYQYVTDIVPDIYELLRPTLATHQSLLQEVDIIVPVPLHAKRFAERGFNQATLIAAAVSSDLSLPLHDALFRSRYTEQQARLEKEEREKNTFDAFSLRVGNTVSGKDILLMDDVFTTGSTMQAAAKALRESGASSVIGMSVARG